MDLLIQVHGFGTTRYLGSKHRKTGRVYSYPSDVSSKYTYTVLFNRITHGIYNSLVTITNVHHVIAFSVVFEESAIVPAIG